VAVHTKAGDEKGAALARLDVAYALRDAQRLDDAAEAAEEAVRALDRAGPSERAALARHLLWDVYRAMRGYRTQARTILEELLALDVLPEGLPSRASLLEQAAEL
jgi:hypothetical protein